MGKTAVYGLKNPFDSDATNNKENITIESNIFELDDDENDPKEVFAVNIIFFVTVIINKSFFRLLCSIRNILISQKLNLF